MNHMNESQSLTPLELRAKKVADAIASGNQLHLLRACYDLEQAISLGGVDISKQEHYFLLGSSLLYCLINQDPKRIPYSVRSKLLLFSTHYCLTREIHDMERGEKFQDETTMLGALIRAFTLSHMFSGLLYNEVYSLNATLNQYHKHFVDVLYSRTQKPNHYYSINNVIDDLFKREKECYLSHHDCIVEDRRDNSINNFMDELLKTYEIMVLPNTKEQLIDLYDM